MVLAYIRISTNKQDIETQKLQIFKYAHKEDLKIDEFIEVQESSAKSLKQRKINELKEKLKKDDILIVYELSRLGRSMFETINLVLELSEKGVQFIFLKQPELSSFKNAQSKLLLTFYAYIAEVEKDFISQRTKAGLEKARSSGKVLGRPIGSHSCMYDEHLETIKELIAKELSLKSIWKFIGKKGHYVSFYNYCKARKLV